jgi:hypothetical protein
MLGIGLFVLMLCSSDVRSQATTGVQTPYSGPFADALERRSREAGLRSITMMGKDKADPRVYQAFLDQLNDDFQQIQLIRIGMIKNIAAATPIEYKQLSKDASEIRKRALRMKTSLALTENTDSVRKEPVKVEYQNDTIQKAASDLCLEISRFTTSPLFKPGAVYNLRYATEADNALDAVINISSNIKTSAEKLRKSH